MDAVWFYIFAVIPAVTGGFLWLRSRDVSWTEWLGGSAIGFAFAGLFHLLSVFGATRDQETWSGQIVEGRHRAAWQEYYEEAIYRTETYNCGTDSKGNAITCTRQVFDHWASRRRWHLDQFTLNSNIDTEHGVDRAFWYGVAGKLGGFTSTPGTRRTGEHASKMIGGDPNDYVTHNKTGWIQPITKHVAFENKVKATPTTFSFPSVPKTAKVFAYPPNDDSFRSSRLLGSAAVIDLLAFDQMNARLGPRKKVNIILVGFGSGDSMLAQWQEAAWVGGKKNDVVICWGGANTKPTWVRAFGWTDSKTCLRNLESIMLEHGATIETLALIEQEIGERYRLKDWNRAFAHVRVPAPMWAFWTYLFVAIAGQLGFWWWAHCNEFGKGT